MMPEDVRDPRRDAMTVAMDLTRPDIVIHRDLRALWPLDVFMWWELEPDDKSGWVYGGCSGTHILAKIVHVDTASPTSEATR